MSSSYRDLIAWRRAMDLVVEVYDLTGRFPREEMYGLVAQMRKSGVSVPSNIAEGQGRLTVGEFKQFLGVARGSLYELETQILLSQRLTFATSDETQPVLALTAEVSRVLNGLIASLDNMRD